MKHQTPTDMYLTTPQLAALLHVTTRTIERWRRQNEGPTALRAGRKKILYRRSDVDAWLDGHVITPTAD